MTIPLDLSSSDVAQNPHVTYRRFLNEFGHVYYNESDQTYYIAGYHQIQYVLKHSDVSSERVDAMASKLNEEQKEALDPMLSNLKRWVIFLDPPKHTPIRRTMMRALQGKALGDISQRIYSVAEELVQGIYDKAERFDFVSDIAFPLPVMVISELLGADPKDRQQIKIWSDQIAKFFNGKTNLEDVAATQFAIVGMNEYFKNVWQHTNTKLDASLLQALVNLREKGVSDDDLIANSLALIFAGHETTTNLIANGMKCLLEHPTALSDLSSNPSLIPKFLDETLRYESPVQRLTRLTKAPIEIDGVRIPAGERVFCLLGAGNRDQSVFSNPDDFNIYRDQSPSLSFGVGIHLCPGNHLALLESRICFETLFSHFRSFKNLTKNFQYHNSLGLRALTELQMKVEKFNH